MSNTQQTEPVVGVAKGISRRIPIPSCSLTADDLRRLFQLLEEKAKEAADHQVAGLQRQPGQAEEDFGKSKEQVRSLLMLVVTVQGQTGEMRASKGIGGLADEFLPDQIASVVYDSAFMFRNAFNLVPQNAFILRLDFSGVSVLDLTNLALQPDVNQSALEVFGANDSWVRSTFEAVQTFFNTRKRVIRNALHSRYCYDLLLLLFGFPLSFVLLRNMDGVLGTRLDLSVPLFVVFYIYLTLVALLGFRLLFNYTKWVFPKLDAPTRLRGGPAFHKVILGIVGTALMGLVVRTLLRILGVPLF